jgi:hypothetical protein
VADAQPEDPVLRLRRALATLQAAQAEQLRALTAWRASLAELSATASGLQTSLHTYRQVLDTIRTP